MVGGENRYAFDVRDGQLAWQFPVGNGVVYVRDGLDNILALRA